MPNEDVSNDNDCAWNHHSQAQVGQVIFLCTKLKQELLYYMLRQVGVVGITLSVH